MKICCRRTVSLLMGAVALGIVVFFLLLTGNLVLIPALNGEAWFLMIAALSGVGLLAALVALLLAKRCSALVEAWLCYGRLAALGALGALVSALACCLFLGGGLWLYAAAAVCMGFVGLFFGGLVRFLWAYLTAPLSGC